MAEEHSPAGLAARLLSLLPALPTVLGRYCRDLRLCEDEATSKGTREAVMPKDALPISLTGVRDFLRKYPTKQVRWVELMVVVLNRMYHGGTMKSGHVGLSRVQEGVVSHLLSEVEHLCANVGKIQPFEAEKLALGKCKFDCAGEPVVHVEELTAEKVIPCWPKVGEAAVQDVVNLVTKEVREWLENPQLVLLPQHEWPESPAQSRVRATDEEWEKIVLAAHERGMMAPVKDDEVFRDHAGNPVVSGAGGVVKWKQVGGELKQLQRFISILVPSNAYQKHMEGDDQHLPYLGQLSVLGLEEHEQFLVDSEDLTSCFNLFRLPRKWASYFCFSKKVDAKVFGLAPGEQVYAGLTVVPMGWINSVAVIQCAVRRLVFGLSKVPESSEVSKLKRFPDEDSVSLVYLDSFDEIRKMDKAYAEVLEGKMSERHKSFIESCERLRLPLNEGKRLVGAVRGTMQGGLLDGDRGTFAATPDKLQSLIGLGCALLASRTASEYELRHFVGKALFCLAFRRTGFCILESVFYDIEHLAKGGEFLSRESLDEIIMVIALVPLLRMNLRAKWDREVCITDASPTGGGAAVAKEFKPPPDCVQRDGAACEQCGTALAVENRYPCPAGCGAAVCCWECSNEHRGTNCKRRDYPVPKFGERFSGKNAPLSRAVAKVGGIEVQPPFDLLLGSDFFSNEGRDRLKALQDDPLLAAEHWAPECKLFSRARGRPITLPNGKVISGPQPVRDGSHVMGFPWLGDVMKARLRKSNKMALAALTRCDVNDHSDIITTLEHPYNSWLWSFKPATHLTEANYTYAVGSMCCLGGKREKWFAVLNNSVEIQRELVKLDCPGHEGLLPYTVQVGDDGQLIFDTEEEAEYPDGFCRAYAKGLKEALEKRGWPQRSEAQGRVTILRNELSQSTSRLAREPVLQLAAEAVFSMEKQMRRGNEWQHLHDLALATSIRGTDVRLWLANLENQELPYPAKRWFWKEVMSYAWKRPDHINVLEVNAFVTMQRRRSRDPAKHGTRYLSIVDSMVTRGAVAKGRSPSRAINHLLRKSAALNMAADTYPVAVWTISDWNFSDAASRRKKAAFPHDGR